jgi:uncharacterized membrane protein YGL010W
MHPNYWISRLIGIVLLELTILVIFYGYTSFTGHPILWIDISSYVIGCWICQWIDHRFGTSRPLGRVTSLSGLIGFLALGALFIQFTFSPPKLPIFQDGPTGGYGIISK